MKMTATSQLLHNNNFKATILSLHEYMPETYGNGTLWKLMKLMEMGHYISSIFQMDIISETLQQT